MAFQPEPTRTPVSIVTLVVTLKDSFDELDDPYQSASFDVWIKLSDGTTARRRGDLVPHITPAQRQGLLDFMTALRAQATTQIIG